jgi:hypothetical protein
MVYYPCKLMARKRGAGLRVAEMLPRLRCRPCHDKPSRVLVFVTDDPTGGGAGRHGLEGRPLALNPKNLELAHVENTARDTVLRATGELPQMRKLEPLIDRFVEDVLGCIRAASLENLRAALSPDGDRPPTLRPLPRPLKSERTSSIPGRPVRALRKPSRRFVVAPGTTGPDTPRTLAEITNPEGLLALRPETPETVLVVAEVAEPASAPVSESDGPTGGVRDGVLALPMRLREGETLVRDSGAGIVLRRARSA